MDRNNSDTGTVSNGTGRHKTPLKERTQTPNAAQAILLSPNNDEVERAEARAARAAALRRKSFTSQSFSASSPSASHHQQGPVVLDKERILALFHSCIRLASENKINQRNTWELKLIDHLSEIISVDEEDDTETNFQKASCTLEAGVKIYSYRVDSVYSEAYKVLADLNRAGSGHRNAADENREESGAEDVERDTRGEQHRKTQASVTTLEPSFDTLNVKKFDVAFTVDPLYHQTSAQFDEGGAKGLLLNTLSVFDGCQIVFDSWDMPGKNMSSLTEESDDPVVELSFLKDLIEQTSKEMQNGKEITGSLRGILSLLDGFSCEASEENLYPPCDAMDGNLSDDNIEYNNNVDQQLSPHSENVCNLFNDGFDTVYPGLEPFDCDFAEEQEHEDGAVENSFIDNESSDKTVDFLAAGLGFPFKKNAWAGPEHWKFYKPKDGYHSSDFPSDLSPKENKKRRKKREPFLIDYELAKEISNTSFAHPRNQRSLLLRDSNLSVCTLLPEDYHYQPKEFMHLFILPSVMCIKKDRGSEKSFGRSNCNDEQATWETGDYVDGYIDDMENYNDYADNQQSDDSDLVAQPHKVQKIVVNYDRTSKEVDVRALKDAIWNCVNAFSEALRKDDDDERTSIGVSFKSVIKSFPSNHADAAPENISVHLYFICLLHLANEHGLIIKGCSSLDDLSISNI